MNKWCFYSLIIITFFLISSCGKALPKEWKRIEGTWVNDEVLMEITLDGIVKYERRSANEKVTINGWITEYTNKGFAVSIIFTTIDFEVNRKPFFNKETNKIQMVVDGRVLTKREGWSSNQ